MSVLGRDKTGKPRVDRWNRTNEKAKERLEAHIRAHEATVERLKRECKSTAGYKRPGSMKCSR